MNSSLPDSREPIEKFLYFVFNPVNIFIGDKQASFCNSKSHSLRISSSPHTLAVILPRGGGQRARSKEMLLVKALQFTPTAMPNAALNNSRAVVPNKTFPFPSSWQRKPALPSGWGISTNFPALQTRYSPFDLDPTHNNAQHLFLFSV